MIIIRYVKRQQIRQKKQAKTQFLIKKAVKNVFYMQKSRNAYKTLKTKKQ